MTPTASVPKHPIVYAPASAPARPRPRSRKIQPMIPIATTLTSGVALRQPPGRRGSRREDRLRPWRLPGPIGREHRLMALFSSPPTITARRRSILLAAEGGVQ